MSYRGEVGAWDGGPPGAEADYAPQHAAPQAAPLPTTDPWTGVSYSHYGQPQYDYQSYGAPGYNYNYDSTYYSRTESGYYDNSRSGFPTQQQEVYNYQARPYEKQGSPSGSRNYDQGRRSYNSKSRSPYERREREYSRRETSYENERHHRSRSMSKSKYSSDSSRSRSRSYSKVSVKKEKKSRSLSSESTGSRSYNKSKTTRDKHSSTPTKKRRSRSQNSSRSCGSNSYRSKTPKVKREIDSKERAIKEKSKDKRKREVVTPPRKKSQPDIKKKTDTPRLQKKVDRSPKKTKRNDPKSITPQRKVRESSVTPPRCYVRSNSSSSSRSLTPRKRKNTHSPKSRRRRSRSASSQSRGARSRSNSSVRNRHRHSKNSSRSKSKPRDHSKRNSRSNSSRRSTSRYRSRRSRSRSSRSNSRSSGNHSDERRGQFTVADRKRFWKMHRRQEKRRTEKSPPKEVKPPPGAVESTTVDDIEYGDPPEVEGPNFAELLPTAEQVLHTASSSKSKPANLPIKNDGSFLEMFKKMQQETKKVEVVEKKPVIRKPVLPFIGKRRGGRVLKTGLVKKAKAIDEQPVDNTPKDAWSLYMQEVKKYRETSCEEERKTRPKMPDMLKSPADLKTAPFDPRFPNQNQTRHCYQSYLDFHRCQKVRGEKYEACNYFQRVYRSLCPNEWTQKWDDQRDAGTFPGRI